MDRRAVRQTHAAVSRGTRHWLPALLSFLIFLAGSARTDSPETPKVHPALLRWAQLAEPDDVRPVWVFFRDREFASEQEREAALDRAQDRIGDAALARRAKVGASLADEHDLPVTRAHRASLERFGSIRTESRWLNAVSVDLRAADLDEIAVLRCVRHLRPVARGAREGLGPERAPDGQLLERPDYSRRVPRSTRPRDLAYGESYDQLAEIEVPQAHALGYTGARVVVMMLDTGYRKDHVALSERILIDERDFVFGDDETQNEPPDDPGQHWHGTATWGALGGYAPGTLIGPAYRSSFLLAKTEDIRSETPVEEDHYVAALEWGDERGVMVTSASLIYLTFDGGEGWEYEDLDGDTCPITRAIDRAAERGILCVNAMGNMGPAPGSLGEPADADSMVACGAVTSENSIASFSSRGPTADGRRKPEVVARGVDTWCPDANAVDGYVHASGTSLSTPLVGGAAPCCWRPTRNGRSWRRARPSSRRPTGREPRTTTTATGGSGSCRRSGPPPWSCPAPSISSGRATVPLSRRSARS